MYVQFIKILDAHKKECWPKPLYYMHTHAVCINAYEYVYMMYVTAAVATKYKQRITHN